MSKNETPKTNVDAVLEEAEAKGLTAVPEQGDRRRNPMFLVAHEEMATHIKETLTEAGTELSARVIFKANGAYELLPVEPQESVVEKAKGLFNRNKKLVLAGLGLVATTAVLKVLAGRQDLEDDEVVETTETN